MITNEYGDRIGEKMEGEVDAWTVAIGNFLFPFTRDQKKVAKALKKMSGFYGVRPYYPKGTLVLFATENDAKRARNELETMGVKCGYNICKCFIPKEYAIDQSKL